MRNWYQSLVTVAATRSRGLRSSDPGSLPAQSSWRYGRFRDAAQTTLASALSKRDRPLWYAESLVNSARFHQLLASASWAEGCVLCRDRLLLWEKLAEPRLRRANVTALEFGVADGWATRWWSNRGMPFTAWHGFDTFEGLPTSWERGGVSVMSAGAFSPSAGAGSLPTVASSFPYRWHKGLIEATLPGFERPPGMLFVLIDVDLLDPTAVILDWLTSNGRPGDLVYFDEACDPWNEGLALRRALEKGLSLRALGYTGTALLTELQQPYRHAPAEGDQGTLSGG
jgi:hypothetical protein